MIKDSGNLKSIINLSLEAAQRTVLQFEQYQVEAMNELVAQLYEQKMVNRQQVLVKSNI